MKFRQWYLLIIAGFGLFIALIFFTPLEYYLIKYANRVLSNNSVPLAQREQEIVNNYDWTLESSDGESLNMEQYEGDVVLINFWATWCGPCVEEMPDLQKLYTEYNDRVTFLFVARDKRNRVANFIVKNNYNFPVYFESGLTPKQFYHTSIPATYIIGKNGIIEMAKTGSYNWNSKSVKELLDNLLK